VKPEDRSRIRARTTSARRDSGGLQVVEAAPTRAIVIHPDIRQARRTGAPGSHVRRAPEACLEEAVGLALALELTVAETFIVPVTKLRPATLIGAGKVEELKGAVIACDCELVIVDAALSPVQQRNLERAWNAKVLDRTGLILEIFANRARTREGVLQVELAHLTYQKSRLVRSWTHLERQRGGLGFVGGPGETQMEADRRMIQERINRIEKELGAVRRTRALHRKTRQGVPYPVIALVGYTNAGKSTLFNALTAGEVRAEDQLFATLDPTMRAFDLPHGRKAILSDTVGFISALPTALIAAFRATLEEVLEADILLHVRDISHPDSAAQAEDVVEVLDALGIGEESAVPVIEVWNKTDLLDADSALYAANRSARQGAGVVRVSAKTGVGLDDLREAIEAVLAETAEVRELVLDAAQGAKLNWLYENCEVLARDDRDDGQVALSVRVPAQKSDKLDRLIAS